MLLCYYINKVMQAKLLTFFLTVVPISSFCSIPKVNHYIFSIPAAPSSNIFLLIKEWLKEFLLEFIPYLNVNCILLNKELNFFSEISPFLLNIAVDLMIDMVTANNYCLFSIFNGFKNIYDISHIN